MAREWNSGSYHKLSGPQFGWGLKVLDRLSLLPLRGDEQVLDAGCGTGRVTAELLKRYPQCRVTAVDSSLNMVEQARTTLSDFGSRVKVRQTDLMELNAVEAYDLVFSTAVFHWVPDHDRLFANIFRALRHGGFLFAQSGGGPNLKRLRDRVRKLVASPPYSEYFENWKEIAVYEEAEPTAQRLRNAGFVDVETSLEEAPVAFANREDFKNFCATMILHPHLSKLPEGLREPFLDELVQQAEQDSPALVLDYWRLNMKAAKP
jgi:trans-aconitate 2-methyltransferase